MECPAPLRQHLLRLLEKGLRLSQLAERTREENFDLLSFVDDLTEEILSLGLESCREPKEYARWVAQNGEIISKCFSLHPDVVDLVVMKELTPLGVIGHWNDAKEKNERLFRDITSHHRSLIVNGWDLVALDSSALNYSCAAAEMGKKDWVRGINEWMESQILKYFRFGGARKHFLRNVKREQRDEVSLPIDLIGHGEKVSVLDVGSCYNYFLHSTKANNFDILAVDLCPAHASVYRGDFLTIQTGQELSCEPSADLRQQNSDLQITQLPIDYFDAVTLSLVLSFLPSFHEREMMIDKAYVLLARARPCPPSRQGLLVIAEKASIFPRTKQAADSQSDPSPEEWIDCICRRGFSLVTYQSPVLSEHKVHLFVFAISAAGEREGSSPAAHCRLRIKSEQCTAEKIDNLINR